MHKLDEASCALIASYLPSDDYGGRLLRKLCGRIIIKEVRGEDTYKNGALHSFNGIPAKTIYYTESYKESYRFKNYERVKYKIWYKDGFINNDGDNPAVIRNYFCGSIYTYKWFKNGLTYREDDKPTEVEYYTNGQLSKESWMNLSGYHRENDNPAKIEYRMDGTIFKKVWYKNGLYYRIENKPTIIYFSIEGQIYNQYWG